MENKIKYLYESAEKLGAANAHIVLGKIYHSEDATAVISVYRGVQPDHLVLEKLYEWAEKENYDLVIKKIKELEVDLSFMSESE